jgi:glycerophosphoryl diester phosphodiesterase
MIKIGHRGACGYAPENTLLSFRKALELGVDMIEFDVHKIKSGEVIIIHDKTLNRTTDGKGNVAEKSFEEIRNLDAGKGEKIPTLEEALDLINRKVKVNIELKGTETGKAVAETVKNYIENKGWQKEDFLVSSEAKKELLDFMQIISGIKIGVVTSYVSVGILGILLRIPFGIQKFAAEVGADFVTLAKWFMKKKYVDSAHKNNLKVFVFTINEQKDIDKAKKLGVDGVFSNYPERV